MTMQPLYNSAFRRPAVLLVLLLTVFTVAGPAWSSYVLPEDEVIGQVMFGSETLSAGTIIPYLPDGARSVIIDQKQYFVSGGNWFLPVVGEEGVKYQVVFAPV